MSAQTRYFQMLSPAAFLSFLLLSKFLTSSPLIFVSSSTSVNENHLLLVKPR